MINVNSTQGLMIWLINYFADTFGNSAVLKGGMELRLLDCPRYTNDIDYVFVPFSSRKDVCERVLNALMKEDELHIEHTLNSKCLRILCTYRDLHVQIEINVATECESQELTTASLARSNDLQGRIVRGMRFDIALAHKIAAWNERGLIRDLYDCSFMVDVLAVHPNLSILKQRLARSELRIGRKTKKITMSTAELVNKIRDNLASLTQRMVEEQMRDYMVNSELPGLEKKIRIGINKLIEILGTSEVG
jgi:predicted nucleotidyltransferase component of viral defense system